MAQNKYLGIYLNDHFAGANGGLALARRIAESHSGTRTGDVFDGLAREIEGEIGDLRSVMAANGVRPNPVKPALARAGELLGRGKPNGNVVRRSPLSSLIEIEAMALGVEGKLRLWRSLDATGVKSGNADYAGLINQAEAQIDRIERERLAAAERGLNPRKMRKSVPSNQEGTVGS
jgi:hypothetical protein